MTYVDGFVAAVPTAAKDTYLAYCRQMAGIIKAHGALAVVDCWGEDVPPGQLTSFPLAVKCEATETVAFGWITWPSRAARDEAWKTLMADPRMQPAANPMPYDGKRMIYGGFELISEA